MAKFTLSIETEEVHELAGIVNKIASATPASTFVTEEAAHEPEVDTDKPATARTGRGRGTKKPEPADAAPAPAATAGGATQFAAEVQQAAGPSPTVATGAVAAVGGPVSNGAAPSLNPTAPAGSATSIAAPRTYEETKAKLVEVMDLRGGNAVRAVLQASAGVNAISEAQPSQYAAIYDALQAVKDGATVPQGG